jgi:hypothetical protein
VVGHGVVHHLVGQHADQLVTAQAGDERGAVEQVPAVGGHRLDGPVRLGQQPQGQGGEEGALGVLAQHQPAAGRGQRLDRLLLCGLAGGRLLQGGERIILVESAGISLL